FDFNTLKGYLVLGLNYGLANPAINVVVGGIIHYTSGIIWGVVFALIVHPAIGRVIKPLAALTPVNNYIKGVLWGIVLWIISSAPDQSKRRIPDRPRAGVHPDRRRILPRLCEPDRVSAFAVTVPPAESGRRREAPTDPLDEASALRLFLRLAPGKSRQTAPPTRRRPRDCPPADSRNPKSERG